jgi:hypothetical protein
MKPKKKSDLQTLSLFLILAVLTIFFVAIVRVVLFAPAVPFVESATR